MIDKGQWWEFVQDTGVTPLLFTRSAMAFLMTTESQDLSLTSLIRKTDESCIYFRKICYVCILNICTYKINYIYIYKNIYICAK